jgi:hypothetical protein
MKAAMDLPGVLPPLTPEERAIMRGFAQVFIAEIVSLVAVNWLCATYQRFGLMAPLDIIIVGLHFLPLARILRTPRYYVMGAMFCVIPSMTLILIPEAARLGRAPVWFAVPALMCGLVVWLIAAANLRQVFQLVLEQRAAPR